MSPHIATLNKIGTNLVSLNLGLFFFLTRNRFNNSRKLKSQHVTSFHSSFCSSSLFGSKSSSIHMILLNYVKGNQLQFHLQLRVKQWHIICFACSLENQKHIQSFVEPTKMLEFAHPLSIRIRLAKNNLKSPSLRRIQTTKSKILLQCQA